MGEAGAHHHVVVGEERVVGLVVAATDHVRAVVGEEDRRVGACCRDRVDDGGQGIDVDHDRLGGIHRRRR